MSGDTESKLGELFTLLPEPAPDVSDRALASALAALPPGQRQSRRSARALAILLAASVVLLAIAAGALGAAGALHVSFGQSPHHPRRAQAGATSQLAVPRGAAGIAAIVDGRLWLSTSGGLRVERLPVSAAALSPHALYVAAGIGDSLVAMAPDERRAWSLPTAGKVAAIAWAPDGLRIAYVVRAHGGFRLYLIEGNGRDNHLIDPAVRSVRPSWRADSLAVAYVAAGGRPVTYDLGHQAHVAIASRAVRDTAYLAFAPSGDELAVATSHGVVALTRRGRTTTTALTHARIVGLGWLNGTPAVALNPAAQPGAGSAVQLLRVGPPARLEKAERLLAPAPIEALDATGDRVTVAIAANGARILTLPPTTTSTDRLKETQPILQLPPGSRIESLSVR